MVLLDEADMMTQDAQSALRRIMESFSRTTRFIIVCNFVAKSVATSSSTPFSFSVSIFPVDWQAVLVLSGKLLGAAPCRLCMLLDLLGYVFLSLFLLDSHRRLSCSRRLLLSCCGVAFRVVAHFCSLRGAKQETGSAYRPSSSELQRTAYMCISLGLEIFYTSKSVSYEWSNKAERLLYHWVPDCLPPPLLAFSSLRCT